MIHAKTIRLAEKVHKEALRYSQAEGISLNALIAVALGEYLERKRLAAAVKGPVEVMALVPVGQDLAATIKAANVAAVAAARKEFKGR